MIRRFSVAVAAVVLTGTIASGCSTFSKNSDAARAGGSTLSVDDFETIIEDLSASAQVSGVSAAGASTTTTSPDIPGVEARGVLTRWINAQLLSSGLSDAGSPVDAPARSTAETEWQDIAGERWSTLTDVTKRFLIDERAGSNALLGTYITDAQVEAAYEAGLATSQALCLRVIGFNDAAAANDVYEQLLDGADFAEIADANSLDDGTADGGIFVNTTTNSECSSASQLQEAVAVSLTQTPIGEPSTPIELSGADGSAQYFIFLQRPWSEVGADADPLVRQTLTPVVERELIGTGSASVDSRYGTWDPVERAVLPVS